MIGNDLMSFLNIAINATASEISIPINGGEDTDRYLKELNRTAQERALQYTTTASTSQQQTRKCNDDHGRFCANNNWCSESFSNYVWSRQEDESISFVSGEGSCQLRGPLE